MGEAPQFTSPRLLLCEGPDDKGFLEALIREHHLPQFQICHAAEFKGKDDQPPTGGKNGFRGCLDGADVLRGFDDLKAILIVTDNDSDSALRDLRRIMRDVCDIPQDVTEIGSFCGKPLAVYLIPSANEIGDLESYCLPEIHRVWPNAEKQVTAFLTETKALAWEKLSSIRKAKARAAIVSNYQPDPYHGIGVLFRKGYFQCKNQRFDELVNFLRDFDAFVGI
jgi:hypothetical protein